MYRGDYVGGYGDPGFLGSLGRAIVHVGGGAIGGFLTKGTVGAIIGAASGAGTAARRNVQAAVLEAGPTGSAYTPALKKAHAAVVAAHKHGITRPIGSTTSVGPHQYGGAPIGQIAPPGAAGAVARGYHLDKRTHSHMVRNRRMNWANPRALARAERRAHSFLKHAARFIRYFKPQHPKGRPFIKHRRKAK